MGPCLALSSRCSVGVLLEQKYALEIPPFAVAYFGDERRSINTRPIVLFIQSARRREYKQQQSSAASNRSSPANFSFFSNEQERMTAPRAWTGGSHLKIALLRVLPLVALLSKRLRLVPRVRLHPLPTSPVSPTDRGKHPEEICRNVRPDDPPSADFTKEANKAGSTSPVPTP